MVTHSDGEPSDFELLHRWQQGDAASGNALVGRHYGSVRRFFDLRLNRLSEDLTQRTFLACVEQLDRGSPSSFRAYLFGIARKQMLMHLRKEHRAERAMRFEKESTVMGTSLTGVFAKRREQYFLLLVLVGLPTDLVHTLQLYYWEGMTTVEIGEATETSASTVASRLARARELLREGLSRTAMPAPIRASVLGDLEAWTRSLTQPVPPQR